MSSGQPNNPLLAVDTLITHREGLVLVERKNPPHGWALPGGFVETSETVETAARRETLEETNLTLNNLRQFQTYSDPDRDPRKHVVSVVFTARGAGTPKAATDAARVKTVSLHSGLPEMVFDHRRIIQDFLASRFRPDCRSGQGT